MLLRRSTNTDKLKELTGRGRYSGSRSSTGLLAVRTTWSSQVGMHSKTKHLWRSIWTKVTYLCIPTWLVRQCRSLRTQPVEWYLQLRWMKLPYLKCVIVIHGSTKSSHLFTGWMLIKFPRQLLLVCLLELVVSWLEVKGTSSHLQSLSSVLHSCSVSMKSLLLITWVRESLESNKKI